MPPPAFWSATTQAFYGRFSQKYPGQWAPVPWICADEVHLCQRATSVDSCTVILEPAATPQCQCLTVPTWATYTTVQQACQAPVSQIWLLGWPRDDCLPPLRDGDIFHYTISPAYRGSHISLLISFGIGLLSPGTGGRGTSLAIAAGLIASLFVGIGATPPPVPDSASVAHWLWSPHGACAGPVEGHPHIEEALQAHLEPWWQHGIVPVHPALNPHEQHWVPRSPSAPFVVVLIFGAPAPRAVLLPRSLTKHLLVKAIRDIFEDVVSLSGAIRALAEHTPSSCPVRLFDGDALVPLTGRWRPQLSRPLATHFPTAVHARAFGRWSHRLTFDGGGWVFLWWANDEQPTAVPLQGRQTWDPEAGTLRPALQHLPDCWWPSAFGGQVLTEPLHFTLANNADPSRAHSLSPEPRCQTPASTTSVALRDSSFHDTCSSQASSVSDCRRPLAPETSRGPPRAISRDAVALPISLALGHRTPRSASLWSLAMLACYLAAFGAPPPCSQTGPNTHCLDMSAVAGLAARLHQYWWTAPLPCDLPDRLGPTLHNAWSLFPIWGGGVPEQLFIATDGSGAGGGSWAFLAWGWAFGRWYRIGWAAAPLDCTPWVPALRGHDTSTLASFTGELAALESAALWVTAMADFWQLHTRNRPCKVTIAVDNAAALQIAAGHGKTTSPITLLTRQAWQAAQSRIGTRFCHVHGHAGILINTLADGLAGAAAARDPGCIINATALSVSPGELQDVFPWLWLLPSCCICEGKPALILDVGSYPSAGAADPADAPRTTQIPVRTPPQQIPVHTISANIQSIRDAPTSIFNPSGLAARRQYLYLQMQQCVADIVCLQETRSKTGRWTGPHLLTWRSGAHKGQYGCEVWVRDTVVSPPLTLQDWRILAATPRLLCVTCVADRIPVTITSLLMLHTQSEQTLKLLHFGKSLHLSCYARPNTGRWCWA